MKQILAIEVSPNGSNSASRKISDQLLANLQKRHPEAKLVRRDLAKDPFPHVEGETVGAYFTPPEKHSAGQQKSIRRSNEAVDELLASDIVVISTPMWNFSAPSSLKAWIDHIVRAGRTFTFGPEGLKPLVVGKKVYVVASSGSVFTQGAFQSYDFLVPYLKAVLGFIGMTDVHFVRVEGTNDPASAEKALSKAQGELLALSL
jgi:FMN-dependent NADH-azoreductase